MPAGSLSTCVSHRWSGVPVRPGWPPDRGPFTCTAEVAQQRVLQERVTHAASGECSSARAVGSRLQQARSFFPTAGAAAAVIVVARGGSPSGLGAAVDRGGGHLPAGRRRCAARCSPARPRPFQVLEVNQPSWLGVTGPASSGGAPLLRRGAGAPQGRPQAGRSPLRVAGRASPAVLVA